MGNISRPVGAGAIAAGDGGNRVVCETTSAGHAPFRNTFSFIETFTNPSQNRAGMTFPRLYRWNTGEIIMQNVIVAAISFWAYIF